MIEHLTTRLCVLLALGILNAVVAGRLHAAALPVDQLIKTSLQLDADMRHGADLYRAQCVDCHGVNGEGNAGRLIPALAGQRRAYLIMQLANFSQHDRASAPMHRVIAEAEVRDPQAWSDLASFIGAQPPLAAGETGNGAGVNLGEASYGQWCASCHEDDARGDADGFVPSLRNQHYAYLVKAMRGLATGHRANADPELVRFLNSLDAAEISGIADYLSRKRGPVRDRAKLLDDGSVRE